MRIKVTYYSRAAQFKSIGAKGAKHEKPLGRK